MFSHPLNQGGPSRRTGPIGPSPLSQVHTASTSKGKAADRTAPALPEPAHDSHQSADARVRAGTQTPQTLSYEHLPSLNASVDQIGAAVSAAIGTLVLGGAGALTYQGAKGQI